MAIELRISGPGLDDLRIISAGQAEVVLGRDADCDICLPDPRRNVSRRHLAIWCEDDRLHFRVLSVVNGIRLAPRDMPPGTGGVLPEGQILGLGDYQMVAAVVADVADEDPWAALDRSASAFGASPSMLEPAFRPTVADLPVPDADDPFGDWGFESTMGPGSRAGPGLDATGTGQGAVDLSGLFRGLGLDPASVGPLSEGELEDMGRLMRLALTAVLDSHAALAGQRRELNAEDRTMLAVKNNNPLKADWPMDVRLRYLTGGRGATTGFIAPYRALAELVAELRDHDQAAGVGARAVVEGALRELSPAALKKVLPGGARLFESARLWDAYVRHHEQQGSDMPAWLQRLFDRFFADAYLREIRRLQRERTTRPH
ncbi:MAG: FHA domain-containing protein [Ramlibacter sp.]|nr:FHA domain-containing protein [Ramlibacter sp.]